MQQGKPFLKSSILFPSASSQLQLKQKYVQILKTTKEKKISVRCVLTQDILIYPIRNLQCGSLDCVFELSTLKDIWNLSDFWSTNFFTCPTCKVWCDPEKFILDVVLTNVLQSAKKIKKDLETSNVKFFIVTQQGIWSILEKNNTQKNIPTLIMLKVQGENVAPQQQISKLEKLKVNQSKQLKQEIKQFFLESKEIIYKYLDQFIRYGQITGKQNVVDQSLNQNTSTFIKHIIELIGKSFRITKLYPKGDFKEQIERFTFVFCTLKSQEQQSQLILYHPDLNLWRTHLLTLNNEKFILINKISITRNNQDLILFGGTLSDSYTYNKKTYQVKVPNLKQPLTGEQLIETIALKTVKDHPQEGTNFLTLSYQKSIFSFGGVKNENQNGTNVQIPLFSVYYLKDINEKWQILADIPRKRVGGSIFKLDKFGYLIGGYRFDEQKKFWGLDQQFPEIEYMDFLDLSNPKQWQSVQLKFNTVVDSKFMKFYPQLLKLSNDDILIFNSNYNIEDTPKLLRQGVLMRHDFPYLPNQKEEGQDQDGATGFGKQYQLKVSPNNERVYAFVAQADVGSTLRRYQYPGDGLQLLQNNS